MRAQLERAQDRLHSQEMELERLRHLQVRLGQIQSRMLHGKAELEQVGRTQLGIAMTDAVTLFSKRI